MLKPFRNIDLKDEADKLQQNLINFVKPLEANPLLDGVFLENVTLLNGAINHIAHGLQRAARGYLVCKRTISSNSAISSAKICLTATAPSGWLLCDGSAISRTTYAALFDKIGTTYGIGDGVTTFNIPDFRQKFPIGKSAAGTGSVLGGTGGAINHTHTIPAHFHGMGAGATLSVDINHDHPAVTSAAGSAHSHGSTFGGGATLLSFVGAGGTTGLAAGVTVNGAATTATESAHTHSVDLPALGATPKTPTGSIGLVTGGVDGNAAMASGAQDPPFIAINFIIQVDNFDVNSSVWDGENVNLIKDSFLDLLSAANMTVSLWIF